MQAQSNGLNYFPQCFLFPGFSKCMVLSHWRYISFDAPISLLQPSRVSKNKGYTSREYEMISHLPCDCNKHKKKFETSWHFRLLTRTILMQTVTGLLLPSSSLWANQMQKRKNGTSPAKIKWECLCLRVHGNFFKFQICQFKWKINQNLILKNVPERWKGWKEGIIIGNHQTFLKLLRYLTLESCICFTWLK